MIGIITEVGPASTLTLKSGENRDKRTLTIADESGLSVGMTLWGCLGSDFEYAEGQIMAVKNARVSDYGGKSLNCGDGSSQIFMDPVHPRGL